MIWEVRCYEDGKEVGSVRLTPDCEISDLVVDKNHRRQGIAEKLAKTAEYIADVNNYPRVFATTELTNKPSISLWQKRKYKLYNKFEKRLDGGTRAKGRKK